MSITPAPVASAAELMTKKSYTDKVSGDTRLTRVAVADETWLLKRDNNNLIRVKFDGNFSKKHLFTYVENSAKRTAAAASATAGTDVEADLLQGKIISNLDKRAVADVCSCGHKFERHLYEQPDPTSPTGKKKVPGACKGSGNPIVMCSPVCTGFVTPYGITRLNRGKSPDPLAGQKTKKNTCLILNMVPKADFEKVVVDSIVKAHTGTPTPTVGMKDIHLTWDFKISGAVILADSSVTPTTFKNYKGCVVLAEYKKHETLSGGATSEDWTVYHMHDQI